MVHRKEKLVDNNSRPMPPAAPEPAFSKPEPKSPELERYQNLRNLLTRLPSVVDYPKDYPNSPRLSKIVHRDLADHHQEQQQQTEVKSRTLSVDSGTCQAQPPDEPPAPEVWL